jgi:hypothetical protein
MEFKIKDQIYKYSIGIMSVRIQFPEDRSVLIYKTNIHPNFDYKLNKKKLIKKFVKENYVND